MYSGTTLKQLRNLDTWFGAHQKIDRMARHQLRLLLDEKTNLLFPISKAILRFEGMDGPDAIKRKTPAKDEPWHYYDPDDDNDTQLLDIIDAHYASLTKSLRTADATKASFEAAWLAHAIVDGLTPAHHYPYEKELMRLRGGKGIETRTTPKEKLFMPGDTVRKKMRNNWAMWGDKGLLATHIAFEIGVALIILPMRKSSVVITRARKLRIVKQAEPHVFFAAQARQIAKLSLYEQFYSSAWTPKLARRVRRELIPIIVETVALIWCMAAEDAAKGTK